MLQREKIDVYRNVTKDNGAHQKKRKFDEIEINVLFFPNERYKNRKQTCDEQVLQKPKTSQQLRYLFHLCDEKEGVFHVVIERIQMAYLSLKAINAIIYINMVEHIVQQKEEQTPFEEREVQPFDFSDTELTTRSHVDSGLEEES